MGRGGKKQEKSSSTSANEVNPEAEERKRLKQLAFSNNVLCEGPAKATSVALSPSKTVIKHHGKDILRKSQRKNRFLFSFPGLLAPVSGGKIGELKDLGTKNPILYLNFPQGQMKLFGTIVYPKNRYLTLQFSRGGKNVMCEDHFDNMIVFSDAWWIGKKDENPEEVRLEFPKELSVGQDAEYDFKGGAGAMCERKQGFHKPGIKCVEQESPKTEPEDDLSESQNSLKGLTEMTPTRHSARTAGKTFNFAEGFSGDDSDENDTETSEGEKTQVGFGRRTGNHTPGKTENSCPVIMDIDEEDTEEHIQISESIEPVAVQATKSGEPSHSNQTSLVQATISTMFNKVEEKKAPRNLRNSPSTKVSSQDLQPTDLRQKAIQDKAGRPRKNVKVIKERKTGAKRTAKKKQSEAEDDDIEEFSNSSADIDRSDEEWVA